MATLSFSLDFQAALLASATGVGGILTGAKVGLLRQEMSIAPDTPLAEVTANECNYAGYAQEVVTWNAPSVSERGDVEIVGVVGEFRPTDGTVQNSAWQVFVVSADGLKLLAYGTLDGAPIPMGATTDALVATLRVSPTATGYSITVS